MTKLSVNVNKIALLRNTRPIGIPSVIKASKIAIDAGCHGITVHPRPDQRHIKYSDVYELADMLKVEFNIEGNPFTGRYIDIVSEVKPAQATLVPDSPDASTSDHGWNLRKDGLKLKPVIKKLKDLGIRVSLFVDPDFEAVMRAKDAGADRVELYTEPYASAFREKKHFDNVLQSYIDAAKAALDVGLELNAGHDLNLDNLARFCSEVPGIEEVSIGHALIAEALEMGLHNTVKQYLKILSETEKK